MTPNLYFNLNQQYMQGCSLGQQGMMMEMSGNIPLAGQLYDQALGFIGGSMVYARQSGIFVTDQILFTFGYFQFAAARAKAMMGFAPLAATHLAQSLDALNQAIAVNPNFFQYHAAAGTVLMAQGNVSWAIQAFQRALQLNPLDAWSQWMLASVHTYLGNPALANQYYAGACQAAPSLPAMQQIMPQAPPPGGQASPKQHDWFEIINNALKFGNNLFQSFGNLQSQFPTGGGGSDWGGGWGG